MFDTQIFDRILDGKIIIESITTKTKFFVTHIQFDEINNMGEEKKDRKIKLIKIFKEINPDELPSESFVLGISKFGHAKLGDARILENLRKENLNNTKDSLIGETCIKNNITLVTDDKDFRNKVISNGGSAIHFNELQKRMINDKSNNNL